jgi:hypothetical protein
VEQTQSQVAKIAVSTVPAATVAPGFWQITARTRASTDKATGKKTEIAADQRSRSIMIPECKPAVSSKYVSLVNSALAMTAKAQLEQQWTADPMLREVDAAAYTEDALLLFSAREAESKKLTAAAILAWFEQSELRKEFAAKYTEPQIKRFASELENIAAPVPDYNEEKAVRRIAALGKHERDMEHEICQQMITKLQRRIEAMRKMREDIGDVAEIPE